jgi:hypothetical protein
LNEFILLTLYFPNDEKAFLFAVPFTEQSTPAKTIIVSPFPFLEYVLPSFPEGKAAGA